MTNKEKVLNLFPDAICRLVSSKVFTKRFGKYFYIVSENYISLEVISCARNEDEAWRRAKMGIDRDLLERFSE
jgi:hypothetical protein